MQSDLVSGNAMIVEFSLLLRIIAISVYRVYWACQNNQC